MACRYAWIMAVPLAMAAGLGVFSGQDGVGAPGRPGSVEFAAGTYRVAGSGANIWGAADSFHFVHKKLNGDATLSAGVAFEGAGTHAHRKAGLMVRQSLDAGSPYADVMIHGDGLIALQYRETPGAATKEVRANARAPVPLRLERRGNLFTVWAGDEKVGPVTVELTGGVYIGLVVCSHDDSALDTAVFSNVSLR